MNKCLNCGKEISQKEGARERKFCDNQNACKQSYHNKNKKEPRFVRIETYNQLKEQLEDIKKKVSKERVENNKQPTDYVSEVENETPNVEKQKRIAQLEYELDHPPTAFSSSIARKVYFFDREKELKSLK